MRTAPSDERLSKVNFKSPGKELTFFLSLNGEYKLLFINDTVYKNVQPSFKKYI